MLARNFLVSWLQVITLTLCTLFLVSCGITENQHRLNLVPEWLNVTKVLYAKEEYWGGGPGGNETGVILYELPDDVTQKIQNSGLAYLNATPIKKAGKWQQTPILADHHWADPELDSDKVSTLSPQRVKYYLNQYGFGIPIDPNVEKEIDSAINKSGSYFVYARTGILIVIPSTHKVAFIYCG